MVCKYDGRKMSGKCRCVNNYEHFRENDIYTFEYKPNENNCWLYYLTNNKNGIVELCNWSFFDKFFEEVEDDTKDKIIDFLLDAIEEEHMGMRSVVVEEINRLFGVDV